MKSVGTTKIIYARIGELINNENERSLRLSECKIISFNGNNITEFDFKKTINTIIFAKREILKGEYITQKDVSFYRSNEEGVDCNVLYKKEKLVALKNIDKGVVIKKYWIN